MPAWTLQAAIDPLTIFFVLATMLSVGLDLTFDEILASLNQRRLLSRALLANLVLVPLFAAGLVRAVPMETGYVVGILLIAIAPGAPFGPKFAEISKSDIAFASGLMAVLGLLSVVTIPLSVTALMPGDVAVDPIAIARMIFLAQLVPLVVGLITQARYRSLAARLSTPLQRLSTYSLLLLIGLLVATNFDGLVGLTGTGTIAISVFVIVGSLVLGYAFGGPARTTREVLATTTAARNAAVALLIATTFSSQRVLTVIVAFSLVSVGLSGIVAGKWR